MSQTDIQRVLTLDERLEITNRGWRVEAWHEVYSWKRADTLLLIQSLPAGGYVTVSLGRRCFRTGLDHGLGKATRSQTGDGPTKPISGRGWRLALIRQACDALVSATVGC